MAKVFLSYVTEDLEAVRRLANDLQGHDIQPWLDRDRLNAGVRWKDEIRSAIANGDFFVACFSTEYYRRQKSFMNDELLVAIEQLRQKSPQRIWFIPVLLNDCDVPSLDIGGGRTLIDLQWVNLHLDWDAGIKQIARTIMSDELESAKRSLASLATRVTQRAFVSLHSPNFGPASSLANEAMERYQEERRRLFERFGVSLDPLNEM
jgi:hypothetical protein